MTTQYPMIADDIADRFRSGLVIPAHPLALTADKKIDERHQRGLTRYYLDAGAGGLAVGVHTTQFEIHEPTIGLYRPTLQLAAETTRDWVSPRDHTVMIAGICGRTDQAVAEAAVAAELGYHIGMISLAALDDATEDQLVDHARAIAEVIPIMGFYLQPAVGGRLLSEAFWSRLAEIPNLVGVKISPFNRYQTLDVLRAIGRSGRVDEIGLYTGNDDSIVVDLLARYEFALDGDSRRTAVSIVGGLLGHWSFWTHRAVELLDRVKQARNMGLIPADLLTLAGQTTEANAAVFDPQNGFAGCIAGIMYVLSTTGLVGGIHTLNDAERLSRGQKDQIDHIIRCNPHLTDNRFVAENLDRWLGP